MKAIVNVADTGPLESIVVMLQSVGYECYLPDEKLRRELRAIGCDTVLEIDSLVRGMGYEYPSISLKKASSEEMMSADLFVDVKAHRNYGRITKRWPNLTGRVLWYRINGGEPEHVIKGATGDMGNEIYPPCPILTPNQWYKEDQLTELRKSYVMYPPFVGIERYDTSRNGNLRHRFDAKEPPVCLIHNATGWGYGKLMESLRINTGLKIYGRGSPDGLINHRQVPSILSRSIAMIHLKSSDAPGYAIYECLASGCPLICSRRLIWRNRMQDLLIPDETCLVFDQETHDELSAEDVRNCLDEIYKNLNDLRNSEYNQKIGMAGQQRLHEIMWSSDKTDDVESLRRFFRSSFPRS